MNAITVIAIKIIMQHESADELLCRGLSDTIITICVRVFGSQKEEKKTGGRKKERKRNNKNRKQQQQQ